MLGHAVAKDNLHAEGAFLRLGSILVEIAIASTGKETNNATEKEMPPRQAPDEDAQTGRGGSNNLYE